MLLSKTTFFMSLDSQSLCDKKYDALIWNSYVFVGTSLGGASVIESFTLSLYCCPALLHYLFQMLARMLPSSSS